MENDTYFSKTLQAGSAVRPFMVAGTLEKDYTGTRDRKEVREFLESSLAQASMELVGKDFKEYDSFEICGMQGKWNVCSALSPRYAAGHYYIMEKLGIMPIYLHFETIEEQTITVKINAGRIIARLNDETVYNNIDIYSRPRKRRYVFEHVSDDHVELATMRLKAGKNTFTVVTGSVGRGTGMQFSMELVACEAPVVASVPLSMDESVRGKIYASQLESHLVDDIITVDETPVFHLGASPLDCCRVTAHLSAGMQPRLWGTKPGANPAERFEDIDIEIPQCGGDTPLPVIGIPGSYQLQVRWNAPDGTVLCDSTYDFTVNAVLEPMPGYERLQDRRQIAAEMLATKGNALALFKLGRADEISLEMIDAMCKRIEQRADCADFDLLPLLWLIWEDRQLYTSVLDPFIKQRVREAALSFRYWVDEPESSSMFYCSENHRIGFHVCEYLAGLLYPVDMFSCARQNGMYHSMKGRMHLVEWLNQRCRAGFDEPHSDSYLPVTMSAILVLREVLPMEEYNLRNMVNILLDFMTYIYAVSCFDGVMATPRGRSYNMPLRSRLRSSICGSFWLLFGNAPANPNHMNQELVFSPYIPPRGICELADNFTPATFTFKQGIMHFDKHTADFTIRRTADYMIGGVRDHNVGMCDMHFISEMIALRNDISICFSAPQNTAEGSGLRPDYWAGQAFLPRVLMGKRTLAVIWHNVNNPDIWMTHCHFNKRKFDEVVENSGWTFGRSGNGYVGIWSSKPHSFRKEGVYSGRELICDGNEAVWIAECGCLSEDGPFEEFMSKMLNAEVWVDSERCIFVSPGSGRMEFGLEEGFTIDGADVPISDDLVNSPWLTASYGSGKFVYTVPGFTTTQYSYPVSR